MNAQAELTTPKNIEDPDVARVIREIGGRWPVIGAAADHPLTEFFMRSVPREKSVSQNEILLGLALIIACRNSFPDGMLRFFDRWFGIAILAFVISMIIRAPFRKKQRARLSWKQLLFSKEDKNRWVWLSGLQLPECAAIAFTYEYWKGTGARRAVWFYVVFTAVVACWLTGILAFAPGKFYALLFYPIGMLYIRGMLDTGIVAVDAIAEAEDPLDRFGVSKIGTFLTVLVGVVCIGILSTPLINGVIMAAMLCAFMFFLPQGYTKHVNARYESLLKEEATYFKKLLVPERFK